MQHTIEEMNEDKAQLEADIRHLFEKFRKKYGNKDFELSKTFLTTRSCMPPIMTSLTIDIIF